MALGGTEKFKKELFELAAGLQQDAIFGTKFKKRYDKLFDYFELITADYILHRTNFYSLTGAVS